MSPVVTGREAFIRTIAQYKQNGERELLATGIVIDDVLVRELRGKGSDLRFGVALICRPNREVVKCISAIQLRLFQYEPAQYYYPRRDLHLTVAEICTGRTREDANRIAAAARSVARLLERESPAGLDSLVLAYDGRGAALNFLPSDARLQQLRQAIREDLARNGVSVESRYPPMSAHVTLLRYIAPLRTPAAQWVEVLNHCEVTVDTPWVLSPVWLTWGATWYGMHGRISRYGPMVMGGSLLPLQ
jgi:2'-5' RNA ligase